MARKLRCDFLIIKKIVDPTVAFLITLFLATTPPLFLKIVATHQIHHLFETLTNENSEVFGNSNKCLQNYLKLQGYSQKKSGVKFNRFKSFNEINTLQNVKQNSNNNVTLLGYNKQ